MPLIATALITAFGWRTALQVLGVLMMVIAFPVAWFVRDSPEARADDSLRGSDVPQLSDCPQPTATVPTRSAMLKSPAFYLLLVGSMCSIAPSAGRCRT